MAAQPQAGAVGIVERKPKWYLVRFPTKPSLSLREEVRQLGARWDGDNICWRIRRDTTRDADLADAFERLQLGEAEPGMYAKMRKAADRHAKKVENHQAAAAKMLETGELDELIGWAVGYWNLPMENPCGPETREQWEEGRARGQLDAERAGRSLSLDQVAGTAPDQRYRPG